MSGLPIGKFYPLQIIQSWIYGFTSLPSQQQHFFLKDVLARLIKSEIILQKAQSIHVPAHRPQIQPLFQALLTSQPD